MSEIYIYAILLCVPFYVQNVLQVLIPPLVKAVLEISSSLDGWVVQYLHKRGLVKNK